MSSLPLLKYRALDSNGDPVSGAELYFYEAGTVTPLDTYSDEELSSANANPVVADSNGYFDRIFMKTDQEYKVRLEDGSGNLIWEEDDVDATALAGSSLQTRIDQISSNPLGQGAAGDGSTDDSTELQAAIDAATGAVDLLGKTYRCDSQLLIDSDDNGLLLHNGELDFSQAGSPPSALILIQGSSDVGKDLTSNASRGDTSITPSSTSGFQAGDWLYLVSDADWDTSSGNDIGEFVRVESVGGGDLNLSWALSYDHTTANNAKVETLSPVENITLKDITITFSDSAGAITNILVEMAHNVVLDNVKINGVSADGISLVDAIRCTLRGCHVLDGDDSDSIGIREGNTLDTLIDDCHIDNLNKGMVLCDTTQVKIQGGVTKGLCVRGGSVVGYESKGIEALKNGDDVWVDGTRITGKGATNGLKGVDMACAKSKVTNCYVLRAGQAIEMSHALEVSESDIDTMYHIVENNTIEDAGVDGIVLTSSDVIWSRVSGNTIEQVSSDIDAIAMSYTGSGCSAVVSENITHNTLDIAVDRLLFSANEVYTAFDSVYVDAKWSRICGNYISSSGDVALTVENSLMERLVVSGNELASTGSGSDDYALHVKGSNGKLQATISGNNMYADETTIRLDAETRGVTISGNCLEVVTDSSNNIEIEGNGSGNDAANGLIVGNQIYNGDYGIEIGTDTSNWAHDGNMFVGQATGNTTGTISAGDAF